MEEDVDELDLKRAIKWVSKIAKQGEARIITVPKNYWQNKIVKENKIYMVYLIEIGTREDS